MNILLNRLRAAGCCVLGCGLLVALVAACACAGLAYWVYAVVAQR